MCTNRIMKADLHIHTDLSDGKDNLEKIIKLLGRQKSTTFYLAITDHHYLSFHRPKRLNNFFIIPGIEISANLDSKHNCHLVGYSLKPLCLTGLERFLGPIRNGYQRRARKIYKKLINLGFRLGPFNDLRKKDLPKPVYTYDFASRLRQILNLTTDESVIEWTRSHGDILYVKEKNFLPSAAETISALHKANFKVFWAHPGTRFVKEESDKLFIHFLYQLKRKGLDGIEAFTPIHTSLQKRVFTEYAKKLGLVVSGGSDYHGEGRGVERFYFGLPRNFLANFLKYFNIN